MKKLLLLVLFVVSHAHAEAVDETISNTCMKQAVAFAQQLKAEIYTDMNREQASKIIRLSSENCKQHFSAAENRQAISQTTDEKKTAGATDWFTEKVLSGEPADKPGNKRLKRMQTK